VWVSATKRTASKGIYFTASDNEACGRSNQSEKQSVVTLEDVDFSKRQRASSQIGLWSHEISFNSLQFI
jgi:hypothetical protein